MRRSEARPNEARERSLVKAKGSAARCSAAAAAAAAGGLPEVRGPLRRDPALPDLESGAEARMNTTTHAHFSENVVPLFVYIDGIYQSERTNANCFRNLNVKGRSLY